MVTEKENEKTECKSRKATADDGEREEERDPLQFGRLQLDH